jgi:hypothetical protein
MAQWRSNLEATLHDADEIREQMRRVRATLKTDVCELVEAAREKTDWRHYVRNYPWLCLGAAAAVGFSVIKSRPRPVPLDESTAIPRGSARVTAGGPGGAFPLNGFAWSLIRAASQALLRRGLEALTSPASRTAAPRHRDNENAPSNPRNDVGDTW